MNFLKPLFEYVSRLFRRSSLYNRMDDEIRFHLEEHEAELLKQGMSPKEARIAALKEFGHVDAVREDCQESWGILWLETTILDFKYAIRQMVKLSGFTALIILTLALGIGACTTIFSVMQATILNPLPVKDQDRLFLLWENNPDRNITEFSVSFSNYIDYRDQTESLDGILALRGSSATVIIDDTPERLESIQITAGAMKVFGWNPVLGREFNEDEDQEGAPRVTMISESFWKSRFLEDPNIIGTRMTIDRESYEVIGVYSDDTFVINGPIHIWKPLIYNPNRDERDNHDLMVCGRLKNGVSLQQAQADMDSIAEGLRKTYPDVNKGWGAYLEPLYDEFVPKEIRTGMVVLFSAVGMLLLIACANVANLLLSRATTREKEIAVRVALGAKRGRVVRQLLSESGLYCFMGTLAGVFMSFWGVKLVHAFAPANLPRAAFISLDWKALAFAVLICVATVVLSGLVPALKGSKANPASALGGGLRAIGAAPSKGRMRSGLVVFQLALSLCLVAGAGLLIKSFKQLQNIDPGFNATDVLTFRITPNGSSYGDDQARSHFYQNMIDRIEALPGVSVAGMTSSVPFGPGRTSLNVFSVSPSELNPEESIQSAWRIVSPKYFDTMKISIAEGRVFTRFDIQGNESVMVISQELADQFWHGESALGKQLNPGGGDNHYTVIGVVGNARISNLTRSKNPTMFFSSWQWWWWDTMNFVVRTNQASESMISEIREIVHDIDPAQPVFDFQTMEHFVDTQVQTPRLSSWLLGIFASVALILASVGVYGVIASTVSQSTNEIGVRMALGAKRKEIVSMILKQGTWLLALGLGIGSLITWQFSRLMQSQLYGVETNDMTTHAAAAIALGLAAIAASLAPVLRATKIDPMRALRME